MPVEVDFTHQAIDLEELQSFDSAEIIRHKLQQAYDIIKGPVVVEDVSAGFDAWHGLPGPFVKFFNERLGNDALYKVVGDKAPMSASCTIGYYDGQQEIIVTGTLHGKVVSPRGESFGFDSVFQPDGQTKTYAEMSHSEKDAISHRRLAIDKLMTELKQL